MQPWWAYETSFENISLKKLADPKLLNSSALWFIIPFALSSHFYSEMFWDLIFPGTSLTRTRQISVFNSVTLNSCVEQKSNFSWNPTKWQLGKHKPIAVFSWLFSVFPDARSHDVPSLVKRLSAEWSVSQIMREGNDLPSSSPLHPCRSNRTRTRLETRLWPRWSGCPSTRTATIFRDSEGPNLHHCESPMQH